ncbi:BCAM0308 family protein [Arhodomonas sp. AD133]|uniref:BCAM0308 family protein n=1 Tax=Arhodomonas sp. AD133 TaxID=3415009 RepID=UPI003EBB57F2
MSARDEHRGSSRSGRRDRLVRAHEHDTYRQREKPPEPSACPDCGAVFRNGRWQWGAADAGAHQHRCPACARIHDHVPAAFLTATGAFVRQHRDEIEALIRHREEHECREHPLKRIMAMTGTDDRIEITFTEPHLARGVGEALRHAYKGELEYHYADGAYLLRVSWHRDA